MTKTTKSYVAIITLADDSIIMAPIMATSRRAAELTAMDQYNVSDVQIVAADTSALSL